MVDLVWGMAVFLFAVILVAATFGFPETQIALSPAVFPRVIGGVLMVLSILLAVRGGLQLRNGKPGKGASDERAVWMRLVLLVVASIGYVFSLGFVGFVGAGIPYMAVVFLIFGERRPLLVGLLSFGIPLVIYSVFRLGFQVPLPRGVLW
ncbi:tripartite tricarboxylate transporter TctB family protein [Spirochaeta thermophila]|uniref:DUF1468 domain-containing protein n=1 Tax=Winmispira thermophila (strain ATCC 49972 / DSM 6192 / RI 19.B1) TaxID=665571 RepID=E0RQZ7_WINT6|nr:tripartite tricarboxylate transporter TctB family protein [Spirochaeta thermophila]ADN01575.1 hypothetical protein STHERM_c06160 [Spirochaeta thermophila DSM 6192]